MSRVGEHIIREDLVRSVTDRIPEPFVITPIEEANPIREALIVQPDERARTTPVKTLSEFYDLFKKVLELATQEDGTAYPIRFTESYPPIQGELPCFTVKLLRSEPLNLNGKRERSPRFMHREFDPEQPGNIIEYYQRRNENVVEIIVWAATNKVANKLADWVEDQFFQHLWAFQWGGIGQPVLFEGRGEDMYREVEKQMVYGRPLRFFVITGKITTKSMAAVRRVAIQLGISLSETIITGSR